MRTIARSREGYNKIDKSNDVANKNELCSAPHHAKHVKNYFYYPDPASAPKLDEPGGPKARPTFLEWRMSNENFKASS